MQLNILIVGVGGQGTLTASRILGKVAEIKEMDVKLSEVHGMAQRGGSVVTHVCISSDKVFSPLIDLGGADIIIAFEKLEALRYIEYLAPKGKMFVNTQEISPMPVITGKEKYPGDIETRLEQACGCVTFVPADKLAKEAGNIRAVNTVLLGAAAAYMDIEKDCFIDALKQVVKPKLIDMNIDAFNIGYAFKGDSK